MKQERAAAESPSPEEPTATRLTSRDLTLAYGDRVVSTALNLDIPDGAFTAIVGANACGKSTLLKVFVRLLTPTVGSVRLDDRPVTDYRPKAIAREIGFLPQGLVTPENISVRQLVARGRFAHQSLLSGWSAADERAVRDALSAAGIVDLADRPVDNLSGGQRQRAWVAMVLAQETSYLLLDEPTTFLDIRVPPKRSSIRR